MKGMLLNRLKQATNECHAAGFSVPKLNISSKRPSNEEISIETIEAIKEITKLDQEFYDWAYQLFNERFDQMIKSLLVSYHKSNSRNINASWYGPLPIEERRLLHVEIIKAPPKVSAFVRFQVQTAITNNSNFAIISRHPNPINISYHWIEQSNGLLAIFDGERTKILPSLLIGEKREFSVSVESPNKAGRYVLRVTIVQEGVAWFDDEESQVFSDFEIVVQ